MLRASIAAVALGLAGNLAGAPPPAPRGPNVVLVHGFWDTGAIFDPLVAILEKQGCRCFAPSFRPNDFRFGVHAQALQLAAAVDARFGKGAPLVFVCFSNGGLVSRDYVENMGARRRTRAMFFISTAHRGTLWAALSPRRGAREFAPGSAFLRALDARAGVLAGIPVHAYWTPFDLVVIPASNTRWPFDDTASRRVLCPFHPWMVRNREVMADIAARIARLPAVPRSGKIASLARAGHPRAGRTRYQTGRTSVVAPADLLLARMRPSNPPGGDLLR